MRILFLSTWFPYPPDNGSKIRVYHLLRALGRRHTVHLVSFSWDTARPASREALPFCETVHAVQRSPFARGRLAQSWRFFSLTPVVTQPLAEMQSVLAKIQAEQEFDAVVASTEVVASYALAARSIPVKILEEHNSFTRMMADRYRQATEPLQKINHFISWQKTRIYEARLLRRFDLCTMVSEADRAACYSVLPNGSGRIEVIPNGVDCTYHQMRGVEPKPHTLVYNGALTYSANYDAMRYFLAEIYPLIKRVIPDVALTITGSTHGVDLSGLQLDDSVHLTGYVQDIRAPVAQSAACVVPLRYGGGTRLKILEAMALGTPVIATAKGAEGLSVRDGEHLLLADDPPAFAERTALLLGDPALCRRLATNARQLVETKYDWQQIGQQYCQLIEKVVPGSRASSA